MNQIKVKTPQEIAIMREGGKRLIRIFMVIKNYIKPGVTLLELDRQAQAEAKKQGGSPSFLGYQGYPAALCTSVNNGIIHCIPDDYQLQIGDLLSIDCGFFFKGFHTDAAVSFIVKKDINSYQPLLLTTYQALMAGTQKIKAGIKIGEISSAIETTIKNSNLTIMRQFVGHGVGRNLHEPPVVPNFVSHDKDTVLPAGSVIAIEPIVGLKGEAHITTKDGWSTKTTDSSPVAHFEQTIAVTDTGYEILTPIQEIIDFKA